MDIGEPDDEYDATGNRKCYCASRPCGPRGRFVSASTLRRHKKADLAAVELGGRSGRPDCDTGPAVVQVQTRPAVSILGGQQRVIADPNQHEGGEFFDAEQTLPNDGNQQEARFYPARETFEQVPAAQFGAQFGAQAEGEDLNEVRRRRETLTILDRLNELYGVCKGMSNATFSQIASWAYGPVDSVASDVDPEWSERCKDLDPPSSFSKVGNQSCALVDLLEYLFAFLVPFEMTILFAMILSKRRLRRYTQLGNTK